MSKSIEEYCRILAMRGFKRVEVSLPLKDVELIRRVAKILAGDDVQSNQLRLIMEKSIPAARRLKFEEWLASLPNEEDGEGDELPG